MSTHTLKLARTTPTFAIAACLLGLGVATPTAASEYPAPSPEVSFPGMSEGAEFTLYACTLPAEQGGMADDCWGELASVAVWVGWCAVSSGVLGLKLWRLYKKLERALKAGDLSLVDGMLVAISGFLCGGLAIAVVELVDCLIDLIPREEEEYVEDVLTFRRFYDERTAVAVAAGS